MKPLALAALMSLSLAAFAADEPEFRLVIENHKFSPETVNVPAGKKIKLVVENRDSTPEEFESHSLKREKVIPGKTSATLLVGPLKPGEYKFFGEFHEATAKGVVIAK
jgi:plastocyanin